MVEIIPSINCESFDDVREKIAKVEPHVKWCHIDVTDSVFSPHPTWRDPGDLASLTTKLKVEVHLMVLEPEKMIDQWLVTQVHRIIVHVEASKDLELVIKKCKKAGIEVGLAIRPDTFWGVLKRWFKKVSVIQVLGVVPGPSGQKIAENTVDKIMHLRQFCPSCILEVDGGVTAENAHELVKAGANLLVAGSAIFGNPDIGFAVNKLKRLIK